MATQEEKELQAIVAQQQEAIDELRATVNQWRLNGAEDMFGGAGFQRYGGALMRIDQSGIQIDSDDDTVSAGVGLRAIKWVPKFIPPTEDPDDVLTSSPDGQYAQLIGNADDSDNWLRIEAKRADVSNHYGAVESYAEGGNAWAEMRSRNEDGNTQAEARLQADHTSLSTLRAGKFRLTNAVLELDIVGSDPSGTLNDGTMWYRFDTDKFRGRRDGQTLNFAFEDELVIGDASELTIASGAITITGGYHLVDTEGDAANDDLDTINGGVDGQVLVLSSASNSRTVTCRDGNGNLALAGNATLNSIQDTLTLIYSAGQSLWLQLAVANNG